MKLKIAMIALLGTSFAMSAQQIINEQLLVKNNSDAIVTFQTLDNSWLYSEWKNSSGIRKAYMGLGSDLSDFILGLENGANKFLIPSGNVGIGAYSAPEKLYVNGNASIMGDLKMSGTDSYIWTNGSGTGYTGIWDSKNSRVLLYATESTGNVGIGTVSPSTKLDVKGKIKGRGQILLNSSENQILSLRPNAGYSSYIHWVENGVAERGILGFEAGSRDLVYRAGSSSFTNGTERFRISYNGNVGIGTGSQSLDSKLTVVGSVNIGGNGNGSVKVRHVNGKTGNSSDFDDLYLNWSTGKNVWVGGATNKTASLFVPNGNVGIGTSNTKGFKLGVNGKIAATEVKVATYANWADFVFKKDYNLPTLQEVEKHIKKKGHLKNIPSAEEVKKDGFFLGEMDAKLLQKIEELTIYTIQQEKEIKKLKEENKKLESLSARLAKLEKLLEKK